MDLDSPRLLSMARGFAFVFWGLSLAIILFFTNAFVEIYDDIRMPAYVIGSALAAWGLFMLHGVQGIGRTWTRRARAALVMVTLQIYFAPFFQWWQAMPFDSFMLINWLCLLLTGMLSLFYINLLVAESERCLKKDGTVAGLFAASVLFLMIMPFLISVGLPVLYMFRRNTPLYLELWGVANRMRISTYILVALPCLLTLLAVWQARKRCYRRFLTGD